MRSNMFKEDKVAITPNKMLSQLPSIRVTNQLPVNTPIKTNKNHRFRMSKSTLPFLLCELIELIDVGTIVANEVAVAITMAESAETPKL